MHTCVVTTTSIFEKKPQCWGLLFKNLIASLASSKCQKWLYHITHVYLNKMVDIIMKTFSNVFSWKKIVGSWLKLHWWLFLRSDWKGLSFGSGNGWAVDRWQVIIWVNIGSGNGLVPDGTKPLPVPMLTWANDDSHQTWANYNNLSTLLTTLLFYSIQDDWGHFEYISVKMTCLSV